MAIFRSLGLKCVPFLKEIVTPMLNVIGRSLCEPGLRDFLFQQLGELVSIVTQRIRPYLQDILQLIDEYWKIEPLQAQILGLVERLAVALGDEFKPHLATLVPRMLSILRADRTDGRQSSLKVLHSFEVLGANLDRHLHLVVPELVKLVNQSEANDTGNVFQRSAMRTVGYLCRVANVSDFASRIVHPIVRVLESTTNLKLRDDAMTTLCNLIFHIRDIVTIFLPTLKKVLFRQKIQHDRSARHRRHRPHRSPAHYPIIPSRRVGLQH